MIINCIVIDDDMNAVEEITEYIAQVPGLSIAKTFTNPLEALDFFKSSEMIDLVFMDVDMPHLSGIELAMLTRKKADKLIFTTSHPEYALDAFEVRANGFLLKPFNLVKFIKAVDGLFEGSNPANRKPELGDYFYVKGKDEEFKLIRLKYGDIIAFESTGNYIKIHTPENQIITRLTLKEVKNALNHRNEFVQLHRGFVLSINQIAAIEGNVLTMEKGIKIPVGESYRAQLDKMIAEKMLKPTQKND